MTNWHGIPKDYRNKIVTGDARELSKRIPDDSVDLIFTDPPYAQQFLYLYHWLVVCAKRILTKKGFLLSYVPPYHKNIIMKYFDSYLSYFWDYIEYNKGNSTIIWPRKTISRYKSIMAYRKFDGMPATNVLGVYPGGNNPKHGDKRYHKWGQTEDTARYFIEVFLGRNAKDCIVFDPLVGGGTTAAVCKQQNINYVAFEIDEEVAEVARDRVKNTIPPLLVGQPAQLDLMP